MHTIIDICILFIAYTILYKAITSMGTTHPHLSLCRKSFLIIGIGLLIGVTIDMFVMFE